MRRLILGAALLAINAGAWANTSFAFSASGTGVVLYDAYRCPNTICDAMYYSGPFSGTASVQIVGDGADGTYSFGSGLIDFSIYAPLGSEYDGHIGFDLATEPVFGESMSVTVSGGQVVSLDGQIGNLGYSNQYYTAMSFSGMNFSYTFTGAHHENSVMASGILAAVPEPETWALLAGGLGVVSLRRLSKKRI